MPIASIALSSVLAAAPPSPTVHTLDNGVRVIVQPIRDTGAIGVETFYRVGFVDEPAGLAHAAHLLEHVVCMGGAGDLAPGQAWSDLNNSGMHNAETLATFTHYDSSADADQLERILEIEASRLESLAITPDLIAQEAPRCVNELRTLELSPAAHIGKFATMALFQVLHHGADSVRLDIARHPIKPAALEAFHASLYRPDRLTVVIAGDIAEQDAVALARNHLGRVPTRGEPAGREGFTFAPRDSNDPIEADWDGAHEVGAIAFPPPESPLERYVLALWSETVSFLARQKPDIAANLGSIASAGRLTPPGDLPIYFLAGATQPQATGWSVSSYLTEHVLGEAQSGAAARIVSSQLAQLANQLDSPTPPTPAIIERQAEVFAERMRQPMPRARALVVTNIALQLGILDQASGLENAQTLARSLRSLNAEAISEIVRRYVTTDRMMTVRLRPVGDQPAPGAQPRD